MNFSLLEIATALFECLIIHILFNGWFGFRLQKWSSKIVCFIALFALNSCFSLIPIQPYIRTCAGFVLVVCVARILYNTTTFSSIYSSLLYMTIAVVSEYFCLALLSFLNFDTEALMYEGAERAIYLVLAKTMHFAIILIVTAILRKNRTTLSIKQVLPLLPCLIVSIYVCSLFYKLYPSFEESLSLPLVIAILGLLYINGIIVLHTQSIKENAFAIQQQELANQQYEMQVQYYHHMFQDQEETYAIRHDIKKYISGIETLLKAGASSEARKEYEALKQGVDQLGEVVDIGNSVLNAILHSNILRAKEKNISVNLDVQVPIEVPISAIDLSVIIGNTFDNAIEECIALADTCAMIRVMLVLQNNMLFYEISNPCMELPHKKAGKYHGYGLRSVKSCVEKYNGDMQSGVDDDLYKVSVRLNCPSNATAVPV